MVGLFCVYITAKYHGFDIGYEDRFDYRTSTPKLPGNPKAHPLSIFPSSQFLARLIDPLSL